MRRSMRFVVVNCVLVTILLLIWFASTVQVGVAENVDSAIVQALTPPDFEDKLRDLTDYAELDFVTLPNRLDQIQLADQAVIENFNRDELLRVIENHLQAYMIGDDQLILQDRLRAEYTIKREATIRHMRILKRHYLEEGELLPDDPEEIMRLLVSRRYYGENGSGYRGLVKSLSHSGSRIEIHQSNVIPKSMFVQLREIRDSGQYRFRNGVVTLPPSIEYANSPEKVLEQDGVLVYADVWLAVSNRNDARHPRFIRYYWSENDGTWLPMEMTSLFARKRRADPFF